MLFFSAQLPQGQTFFSDNKYLPFFINADLTGKIQDFPGRRFCHESLYVPDVAKGNSVQVGLDLKNGFSQNPVHEGTRKFQKRRDLQANLGGLSKDNTLGPGVFYQGFPERFIFLKNGCTSLKGLPDIGIVLGFQHGNQMVANPVS